MSTTIVAIFILLVNCFGTQSGYIEKVVTSDCKSCKQMLTCIHLSSVIAILDVEYKSAEDESRKLAANNIKDFVEDDVQLESTTLFPLKNPREALNHRCSGQNHCSFILTEDSPGTKSWPDGNFTIAYACISEDRMKRYCNSEIILPSPNTKGISQGFIGNPGYPRFYSGHRKCYWKIIAPFQQRIQLTILDISLIVDNVKNPEDCTDTLEIKDISGQVLHSTCHAETKPQPIISNSETVEVVLTSNSKFNPRRGVLIQYTAIGCPLPSAPEDGFLLFRNDTVAEFVCCVGFVFPDSGRRKRSIRCMGSYWNETLPIINCERANLPKKEQPQVIAKEIQMASDVIAPALLILILFIINGGVLFFIYKAKQKQEIEVHDEEELGTFSTTQSI